MCVRDQFRGCTQMQILDVDMHCDGCICTAHSCPFLVQVVINAVFTRYLSGRLFVRLFVYIVFLVVLTTARFVHVVHVDCATTHALRSASYSPLQSTRLRTYACIVCTRRAPTSVLRSLLTWLSSSCSSMTTKRLARHSHIFFRVYCADSL